MDGNLEKVTPGAIRRIFSRKNISYLAFFVVSLLFFLYFRFPARDFKVYLNSAFSERYPEFFRSFDSVSLGIAPPSLILSSVMLGGEGKWGSYKLDVLRLRPRLLGYLMGKQSLAFSAETYSGLLQGYIDFPLFGGKEVTPKVVFDFEGLDLAKGEFLKDKLGLNLTGKLTGSFVFDGRGTLKFKIEKGLYRLREGLFGMDVIPFDTLEGEFRLRENNVKINKLVLRGDRVNCSLKGDVFLNKEWKNSLLNLNGSYDVLTLRKKVILSISGTLGNAQVKAL